MPFFQGAYNFELHGGIFYGERRHRRLHHTNTEHVASQTLTQKPESKSRPLHLLHTLERTDSKASENITDEEPRTLPGSPSCRESLSVFLTDTLFSQIYMQLLLHLPSHYFDRVDRLSRDANMALKEILDLAVESNMRCGDDFQTQILDLGQHSSPTIVDPDSLPPAYRQLTVRWSCFIDDLLEEWRTLNIVSALLVPWVMFLLFRRSDPSIFQGHIDHVPGDRSEQWPRNAVPCILVLNFCSYQPALWLRLYNTVLTNA